ncbi:MAG: DNA-directed RNA polymerase subunit beta [Proteobacteria bacterium]|uniref:DNA-directed RNA polymerase subunit beta n=1 Tax=Candidatus Enterousia excrementavium TaxID=2840789 RepID=A0A940I9S2_9PROT|nr:DNA-directed RNA polymerase subunit beta [Candidatus Enterousia excrementavium]
MAVIQKFRKSFGKSFLQTPLPDLVEIQYNSYKDFLQADVEPQNRKNIGLQNVFSSMFPIRDYAGVADLEFVEYTLDKPVYNVKECMLRNLTYSSKLKLKLKLILWDVAEDGKKTLREIKDQEIFMGDVPLMTERGSFIAAGVERVIVSQMHRAQGVVFATTKEAKIAGNPITYTARIIPEHGSWIDFEESKGVIYVRIDRRRKIPATVLLRCLPCAEDEKKWQADPRKPTIRGMDDAEILGVFYKRIPLKFDGNMWVGDTSVFEGLDKYRLNYDLINPKDKKPLAAKGDRMNAKRLKRVMDASKQFGIIPESMIGEYLFDPILDAEGNVVYRSGTEITPDVAADLEKMNVKEISLIAIDNTTISAHMRNTLIADKTVNREEALIEIYNIIRPGERPTLEAAINLFMRQGFDAAYYDLSAVGRFKMNKRLKIDSGKKPEDERLLTKSDFLAVLKTLTNIIDHKDTVDDIDNLSNRRVRTVGELLEQNFRTGMVRIERLVRESLSSPNIANMEPQDVINVKPLMSLVNEFLGTSQLSQFMDAYNPLSELEHKRRISALGPGGLNRDRAGIDVRDVHPTHYGRLCPINTPEGANIGLINHLATYARVNPYGFIETPYYVVENSKITDKMVYLTADEELGHKIAQGNTPTTSSGVLAEDLVTARVDGEFTMVPKEEIDLIDVEPRQVVSIATGLIPFVENDDANRALMGSNMQRQAIPLLRVQAPLVGTGIEREVARDSRTGVAAKHSGVVESADANRIVVKCMNSRNVVTGVDIYNLEKFERSNSETLIHQKPLVKVGDRVSAGDIIADGSSMNYGELALGRNVLVAFVPWRGYNYEDSIVISERISRDDVFTSVKIVEKEFKVKDTQLGPESLTRDIPNVSEEALKNLDESGIIYVGARVKQGDILVGRVSPKSETLLTPEEALLRNIFGEKALNVKDTSLRVGPNEEGTVIGVNVLTRHGVKKDERTQMIELQKIEKINRDREEETSIMERGFADQIFQLAEGLVIDGGTGSLKPFIGKKLTQEVFEGIRPADVKKIVVRSKEVQAKIEELRDIHVAKLKALNEKADAEIAKATETNSLGAGVLKTVKVYIAHKMKLQPGDKMAGRHGNKGIVSKVVPIEDMPYMEDGTPVDLVLNPLGVPSRMNLGQILETHLGMAARTLGQQIGAVLDEVKQKRAVTDDLRTIMGKVYGKEWSEKLDKMTDTDIRAEAALLRDGVPMATPTFDGATSEDIARMLKMAKLPETGQFTLYDGMTGEKFARPVTVGVMYMLKLHHLVDEKIHARSIGNYSLVTQQPLSGKAHMGGQRLGEMEVWALEAHGAAHLLREMLTVKSDDIVGRTKMYEAIISGSNDFQTGTPEAFNVFMRELRGLGLALTPKKID